MEVTGWTCWDSPNYIDICQYIISLKGRIAKSIPTKWPSIKNDSTNAEKEKIVDQMKKHNEEFSNALENNDELKECENLYNAIYDSVIENVKNNSYHFTGDEHQNCDYGTPVIDNRYKLCLSMRDWGCLISEAFPDEFDPNDRYNYVKWAWKVSDNDKKKVKIPDKSLWRN